MVRSTVKKVMRVAKATVLINEGGSARESIRLRRELLLVALIVVVVGAVLLAVGANSPTEAQGLEPQQPSAPPR